MPLGTEEFSQRRNRRSWPESEGFGDDLVEQGFVDSAGERLCRTIGLDDHERWLEGHVETLEHLAGVVLDLWKRQTVAVDELGVGIVGASPRDADEVDLICKFVLDRLDRGGFTVANRSSG